VAKYRPIKLHSLRSSAAEPDFSVEHQMTARRRRLVNLTLHWPLTSPRPVRRYFSIPRLLSSDNYVSSYCTQIPTLFQADYQPALGSVHSTVYW